ESLKRWKSIAIFFDGVFYEGGGYVSKGFSIIDEYTLYKESGELIIRFNESYVKQLNETKFYKLIDFEQYKILQKSSSARLYELLVKTFKERNEWAINLQSFAEKMTFEKRKGAQNYYSSDILRYLKPAIDEINKKTDLSFDFYFNKENSACVFKKINTQKSIKPATKTQITTKPKDASLAKQIETCMKQFNAISFDKQKAILNDIKTQPLFKFLPNDETRIFTYMMNRNKKSIESE
ncbi:MAG: replication initiation protein, partial [Myxococcales bacterium]|nr:replication initiation protein [Myxococcales bacterium]